MNPDASERLNDLDEEAFQAALTFLLGEAHEDGIDIAGSWSCRTDESLPDWEVEVFRVPAGE